jgi:hypothetical protein
MDVGMITETYELKPKTNNQASHWTRLEQNPFLVKYAQTIIGKLCVIILFGLITFPISFIYKEWWAIALGTIILISYMPKFRYIWLILAIFSSLLTRTLIASKVDWQLLTLSYNYLSLERHIYFPLSLTQIRILDIVLVLLLSEVIAFITRRYRTHAITHYPIFISYTILISLTLFVSYGPLTSAQLVYFWAFISIYHHYFWFTGYTFLESRVAEKRYYLLDYARYLPIWGFTVLPYGKGSTYLHQVEAKNSEELAVTQLKGLKLIWWAFILYQVLQCLYAAEFYFQVPKLSDVFKEYDSGIIYPAHWAWICLLDRFARQMLELTVWGHIVVAICRMCGFRVFRNTYKPLQATTVAEFFNRYNFYFKEMMAEFYFYPTYFRFFKNHPRIRIFFATIIAATVGNILFHYFLIIPEIMRKGILPASKGYIPFIIYAAALGIAIAVSQLRNLNRPSGQGYWLKRCIISPAIVIFFFLMLAIFNSTYQMAPLSANFKFLFSLFNITGW